MDALAAADAAAFRFINLGLQNRVFDFVMPALSTSPLLGPVAAIILIALLVKGGTRGRLCVFFILLALVVGDTVICRLLKESIGRPRPFEVMAEARVLIGKGGSASMPSSHMANWVAVACAASIFYRRSLKYLLAIAIAVGVSRIYNGVHYPSDVLAGALVAVAYTFGLARGIDALWKKTGPRLFPLWWQRLPSLLLRPSTEPALPMTPLDLEGHWRRLGYGLILMTLFLRWLYIAGGVIDLSEDEAYQWLWSKHLDLSYYSKPPLIAYIQFLGTALWGDTVFGVRFFSPLIGAIISFLVFRFLSRETNPRAAVIGLVIISATPMLAVGATLLTIDAPSVLFWVAATFTGWTAVKTSSPKAWAWTGLWMGLGTLSKYIALFQWVCWAFFLFCWRPARVELRRPGIYLALLINLLCLLPIAVWNAGHDWVTLRHLANRGGLDQPWRLTLSGLAEFLFAETLLLNPVFFLGAIAAAVIFWRRQRDPRLVFLFAMSVPLLLFYTLYTFRARVQPNWIVPAVVPWFCLMVLYWESAWAARVWQRRLLAGGIIFGVFAVTLLHDTDLLQKVFARRLPPERDPLTRVRGWPALARTISAERAQLLSEGPPVFIIGDHYGLTSELAFYLPDARQSSEPLVYYRTSPKPKNQFFFWPGYRQRIGQNAIFVQQIPAPQLKPDWFWLWLAGEKRLYQQGPRPRRTVPPDIEQEFVEVADGGVREIRDRGRVPRYLQIFLCRQLR